MASTGTAVRFLTETGLELPAVSADQMREIDRIAIQDTGPNLYQMMENAGRSLALLAIELLGSAWEKRHILVLAGTGGNGGGGICAARHLANHSARVRLRLADPEKLTEVAALQRKMYSFAGGGEISFQDLRETHPDLVLDALIGYGLRSTATGPFAVLIRWANASGAPILALDVPSGVNATNGENHDEYVHARWTLSLALPKTGLLPDLTGTLFLADIGIPVGTYRRAGVSYTSPFANRFWIPLQTKMREWAARSKNRPGGILPLFMRRARLLRRLSFAYSCFRPRPNVISALGLCYFSKKGTFKPFAIACRDFKHTLIRIDLERLPCRVKNYRAASASTQVLLNRIPQLGIDCVVDVI